MTDRPVQRDLEPGIQRDLTGQMSYGDYLRLDLLLSAQQPQSDPPQHDELLFIIQHQTSELWLKLLVHELRSARDLLRKDELAPALKRLARVKHVQHVLTDQWSVLATLTPSEYVLIRPFLATASGFQSAQYREVEFLLGNKNPDMVKVFAHDPAAQAALETLQNEPSLYDEFLAYLARRGYAVPADLLDRDWSQPYRMHPELLAMFAEVYAAPERALGRLRDLRGARRPRGQLPAVAVPPPPGRAAHDRPQDRHRWLVRRRLPAAGPGPDVLPRALRGAHPHRGLSVGQPGRGLASPGRPARPAYR